MFLLAKVSGSGLGPAGTLEVAVNTTPKGVVTLKGVSKVFGGVVAVGQTTYDVYTDYQTFNGFNKNFALAAGADILSTVVIATASGTAISAGAPVIAVVLVGGGVAYLVNTQVSQWKASLQ